MTKNPNRLLIKIRRSVNGNLRRIINKHPEIIIQPIPKKYLPPDTSLRMLYNEAYYNHYIGLNYSTLSLSNIILERITRIFYRHFQLSGTSTEWHNMMKELKTFFESSTLKDKDELIAVMDDFNNYRKNIRNLLLHGKIEEYLKSTILIHKGIDLSLRKVDVKLDYDEKLHGDKKMEILFQRMAIDSYHLLLLITIVIQRYNCYIYDNLD